jgi:hypothetical protein
VQPDSAAPVRIAIAGTGNIAGVHAAALRGLPGAELAGAADIDPARLAAVLAALRAAAPPPVTLPDSRGTMSLVAGIYASAFGGGVVRPADLGPAAPCYARMDGPGTGWEQW